MTYCPGRGISRISSVQEYVNSKTLCVSCFLVLRVNCVRNMDSKKISDIMWRFFFFTTDICFIRGRICLYIFFEILSRKIYAAFVVSELFAASLGLIWLSTEERVMGGAGSFFGSCSRIFLLVHERVCWILGLSFQYPPLKMLSTHHKKALCAGISQSHFPARLEYSHDSLFSVIIHEWLFSLF